MKYKALFLDLDNTIVDSNAAYENSLNSVFKRFESLNFDLYYQARNLVKKRMPKNNPLARNRAIYFKVMLEKINLFSPTLLSKVLEYYEKVLYSEILGQVHMLNRRKTLQALSSILPIAIITNENLRTQFVKLKAIDPEGRFISSLVTSEEVGYEKPHRQIFETALNSMGCIPQDSLMVGDSLESDIYPSQNLGINAVLTKEFIPNIDTNYTGPNIQKLEDLLPIVSNR